MIGKWFLSGRIRLIQAERDSDHSVTNLIFMDQSSSETVQEILEGDRQLLQSVDEDAATAAQTLKRIVPYWHPYRTYAKQRWWNREILELVSTEFRDRSIEYYVCTCSRTSGMLNTERDSSDMRLSPALSQSMARPHDRERLSVMGIGLSQWGLLLNEYRNRLMLRCRNLVHRHEPPVTSTPVKILLHDDEREIIVIDKPGSIVCLSRAIPTARSNVR